MKEFYDIDALKTQLVNYINLIKESKDVGVVGEIAVSVSDFISYLERQSEKENEE